VDLQVPYLFQKQKSRKQKKSLGYQIRSNDRREKQDSLAGISFCVETVVRQYVQKNDVVHDQSRAMHTSVHTAFRDIRGVDWRYVRWCSTTRHRLVMGGRGLRPCAPCGGVADLRRRRSGGRSHLRHTQMAFRQCGCTWRLERTGAGESLVADLALVLLLAARRDLGAELAHH